MADVTNELMFEVLKQMQERLGNIDHKLDEVKSELQAIRGHALATQQDTANIYRALANHETRFDRIEKRLGLIEPAL